MKLQAKIIFIVWIIMLYMAAPFIFSIQALSDWNQKRREKSDGK